ncbi:MAG: TadE/TadG family type IV pilus assembly protein [Myxococcota bacterium]|jgi:Flp pilus assembly protein TadG|nr:TadE/TadG family type IV pilus assembly protein [Myxococcota bacterium]MDP7434274.1 TadE/TadG family type IV pilus assembly protein [Myxococcota bacterium]HJO24330.1 TadE/TadG family type IV pilus assembly protein [Myxococcota bacterium]
MKLANRRELGSTYVEMVIVLPLLLILLFGIAEFTRLFIQAQIVHCAAREATREATLFRPDCDGAKNAAENAAEDIIQANAITRGSSFDVDVENACDSEEPARVTVYLDTEFLVLARLVNRLTGGSLTDEPFRLSSTLIMRNEAHAGG